jgi:hypothetical protein
MIMNVQDALATMKLSNELKDYLLSRRDLWSMFGKMNSHFYRKWLMKIYDEAGLDGEQRLMVHVLAGVIKNRDRVLRSMETMEPEDKAKAWYGPVMNFINTRTTQYVSDVTKSRKFPFVNIPTCNAGLDILIYCIITNPNDRSLVEMSRRTTFSQLDLDAELQDIAKEGYKYYWDQVVKGTKNPDAKATGSTIEPPAFREEYYANSVNDEYKLVDEKLQEVPAADAGYSLEDLVKYLRSIDPKNEYNPAEAVLEDELIQMKADDLVLRIAEE